jgi:hypothetical protein
MEMVMLVYLALEKVLHFSLLVASVSNNNESFSNEEVSPTQN